MITTIKKNLKAYPVIKREFDHYVEGIHQLPTGWTKRKLFWNYLKVRRTKPRSRVRISEYFIFGFYNLNEEDQGAFMTDYEATLMMKSHVEESKMYLWDKKAFLKTYHSYIHRDWLMVRDASKEEFADFAKCNRVVAAKPQTSSWGIGFRKLYFPENMEEREIEELYKKLYQKNYLLEAYLISDESLAQFHPNSLNTVRIVTLRQKDRFQVFGAGLRVGNNGKTVDNAHGGGIFCEIDPASGTIVSDGLDEYGNVYVSHPITHMIFRGFVIPKWKEMVTLCENASKELDCIKIVGWDIALLADGTLEIIEGNHNPGMNIVQAPAKCGKKEAFQKLIKDFYE